MRILGKTLALIVVLTILAGVQAAWAANSTYWVKRGAAAFKAKDYREAERFFREAIKLDNKNYVAWGNLGITYNMAKQPKQAIAALSMAIATTPATKKKSLGGYYGQRGLACERRGLFSQAVSDYIDALQYRGSDPKIQKALDRARGKVKKYGPGPSLEKKLRLKPGSLARRDLHQVPSPGQPASPSADSWLRDMPTACKRGLDRCMKACARYAKEAERSACRKGCMESARGCANRP